MTLQTNIDYLKTLKNFECPDSSFLTEFHPLVFAKASGSEIWDVEGRRYIDLCAGFGVLALGHNPEIYKDTWRGMVNDSRPEIMHGMGDVYPSADKALLVEKLAGAVAPHLDRVGLALSGAQAVEFAVKTAMLHSRKRGFISFKGGYHGLDLGVLALTANKKFSEPFFGWIKSEQVQFLSYAGAIEKLKEEFVRAIEEQERTGFGTAAVIVEPIQGRGGVRPAPIEWLRALKELCKQHNVLLIFDEVFTGLGRTGRLSFAREVKCDILCIGKALGGGLPLSACLARQEVMNAWPESQGEALHTGTFFGHPLSCRLANLTLDAIVRENLGERSAQLGNRALKKLQALPHSQIREVRGSGLMIGVEFSRPLAGVKLMDWLRARGVISLCAGEQGETLSITPALNIPENIFDETLDLVCEGALALS